MSAAHVASLVLAAVFAASALVKLSGSKAAHEIGEKINAPFGLLRFVGACELLAALGLVGGVVVQTWMGVAASIGLVALMIGAVIAHVRAKEPLTASLPALVLGAVAAVLVFTL
ncbi:MAG TPA: DoxX family protein [Marmoricola sp.]|jgi:hypothetical protein|nr:DoxX family protein [Marmoricola sp.]